MRRKYFPIKWILRLKQSIKPSKLLIFFFPNKHFLNFITQKSNKDGRLPDKKAEGKIY